MPSELKSETARINGAKSDGPTTAEGKEKSSQFKEFLAEHIAIHLPATPPEKELVEQMAIARWRIRRFVTAETVLIDCEIVRNRDKVEKEFATLGCHVHIAMAIRSLADESRCLSLMSRYESRHQRCHDKAYVALRELQKSRASQPTPPAPEPPPAPTTHGAAPTTHNPSVSAGTLSPDNKISPNEPSAPPFLSPDMPLCTPVPAGETGNSEDHDA